MVNLLPPEQKKKVIDHFSSQHLKGAKGMTVLSDIGNLYIFISVVQKEYDTFFFFFVRG
jgi:hypothetical protein